MYKKVYVQYKKCQIRNFMCSEIIAPNIHKHVVNINDWGEVKIHPLQR